MTLYVKDLYVPPGRKPALCGKCKHWAAIGPTDAPSTWKCAHCGSINLGVPTDGAIADQAKVRALP